MWHFWTSVYLLYAVAMARYSGGCHCGAVRFEVEVADGPEGHVALACTCSICTKKGFLHLIVTADAFTQTAGEEALTTYRFNTGVAKHTFCATCGVQAFYTPRSHPDGVSVNLRALDHAEDRARFSIQPFDGANWESNIDSIR